MWGSASVLRQQLGITQSGVRLLQGMAERLEFVFPFSGTRGPEDLRGTGEKAGNAGVYP